jgi:FMN-dependent NADH-azoreductase
MARLLYVEASPRKDRSASIEAARIFLTEYQKTHPKDVVETLDLWITPLPAFDGEVINSKYAILQGLKHTEAQRHAWSAVEKIISHFTSADKYVFSLPMWNFGVPYKLKHYIDVITQPGYTFSFTPGQGYEGLVTGKPVAVIYARGGSYPAGTGAASFDLQKAYMELFLGFIGFKAIQSVIVEPTLSSPEETGKAKATAGELAKKVAATF